VCCVGVSVVACCNRFIQLSFLRRLKRNRDQAVWDTNQTIGVVPLKLTSLMYKQWSVDLVQNHVCSVGNLDLSKRL